MITINSALAKYNETLAEELVYASALAYCFKDRVIQRNCSMATVLTEKVGMEVIHAADNDEVNDPISYTLLVRESQKQIIVAFSGTIANLQLIHEITGNLPTVYDIHNDQSDARVFSYFYDHYKDSFRSDYLRNIKDASDKYEGFSIIFTGHSLGGALTLHAAADSILNGYCDKHYIQVYTFGQPRTGNIQWLDQFLPWVDEYYRLVNYTDAVPHVPPCIPDFNYGCVEKGSLYVYPIHGPTEVWFNENGKTNICSSKLGEDPACSLSVLSDSIDHHLYYFGMEITGLTKSNITASNVSSIQDKISE